jgi:hypothetical protein
VRIKDTLHLEEVEVSEVYAPELAGRPDLEILIPARTLPLTEDGMLQD